MDPLLASSSLALEDLLSRMYSIDDPPPTSIGPLQLLERDLLWRKDAMTLDTSLDALIEFLERCFGDRVVAEVMESHKELQDSVLGLDYFLRGGFGPFGVRVLEDVLDVLVESWALATPPRSLNPIAAQVAGRERGGGPMGPGKRGGPGGPRGGGQGRGGPAGGGGFGGPGLFFGAVQIFDVLLPAFLTPEKTLSVEGRRMTIQVRSMLFCNDQIVHDYDTRLYFPLVDQVGSVTLYHGLRMAAWYTSFVTHEIDPSYTANEFSSGPAFYVSSHLEVAFEHPLHNHPRLCTCDSVSILVFKVLDILHGLRAPPGGGGPFACKWFERDDEAWSSFCHQTLYSRGFDVDHTFDIIIGPSCLPSGNTRICVLKIGSIKPTQIAFCTRRACAWLQSCAEGLFRERRSAPSILQGKPAEMVAF